MALNNPEIQQGDDEKPKLDDPQFFPEDVSDGRGRGEWKTKYLEKPARNGIRIETAYLLIILAISFVIFFSLLCDLFQFSFGLSESHTVLFNTYLGAFLAGLIGGTLYDLKWLIHVVGKGYWSEDRKLWRYITPISSGILSVFVLVIINSGLFGLFSTSLIDNPAMAYSLAFLSGYFSDNIISRLQDLCASIFGGQIHDKTKDKLTPKRDI